jgi:hypothetical protein
MGIEVPISPPFRMSEVAVEGLRMCFPVPEAFNVQSDPEWDRVIHAVMQGAGYAGGCSPAKTISPEKGDRPVPAHPTEEGQRA